MGKIRDLYDARIRPMVPAERLQLARLILDDLAPSEDAADVSDKRRDDDLADVAARIPSPRLARPEQAKDFAKQIVELAPDAEL
jgi:hypothetical protein